MPVIMPITGLRENHDYRELRLCVPGPTCSKNHTGCLNLLVGQNCRGIGPRPGVTRAVDVHLAERVATAQRHELPKAQSHHPARRRQRRTGKSAGGGVTNCKERKKGDKGTSAAPGDVEGRSLTGSGCFEVYFRPTWYIVQHKKIDAALHGFHSQLRGIVVWRHMVGICSTQGQAGRRKRGKREKHVHAEPEDSTMLEGTYLAEGRKHPSYLCSHYSNPPKLDARGMPPPPRAPGKIAPCLESSII